MARCYPPTCDGWRPAWGCMSYFCGEMALVATMIVMNLVDQIEALLLMRHYEGFLPRSRHNRSVSKDCSFKPLASRFRQILVPKQRVLDATLPLLIRLQIEDGFEDGVGLGKDGVFQDGLVGDEGIHGADAADGGVEVFE